MKLRFDYRWDRDKLAHEFLLSEQNSRCKLLKMLPPITTPIPGQVDKLPPNIVANLFDGMLLTMTKHLEELDG